MPLASCQETFPNCLLDGEVTGKVAILWRRCGVPDLLSGPYDVKSDRREALQ